MSAGAPDVDAIAAAVAVETPGDSLARQRALRAHQRRAEVREAAEYAADRAEMLAVGLLDGSASEERVIEAMGERDDARRLLEAFDLAVRAADSSPVLVGRR